MPLANSPTSSAYAGVGADFSQKSTSAVGDPLQVDALWEPPISGVVVCANPPHLDLYLVADMDNAPKSHSD